MSISEFALKLSLLVAEAAKAGLDPIAVIGALEVKKHTVICGFKEQVLDKAKALGLDPTTMGFSE